MSQNYCDSLTQYSRRKTREVFIGEVPLGGNNPIRVQSMTTVDTMDTEGSVLQTLRMVEAGCEYVRITAPSIKEAQNLEEIRNELRNRGCDVEPRKVLVQRGRRRGSGGLSYFAI